jgi:hypothetical protein
MDEGLSAVLAEQPLSEVLTLEDLAVTEDAEAVTDAAETVKEENTYLANATVKYIPSEEQHQEEHLKIKRLLYLDLLPDTIGYDERRKTAMPAAIVYAQTPPTDPRFADEAARHHLQNAKSALSLMPESSRLMVKSVLELRDAGYRPF